MASMNQGKQHSEHGGTSMTPGEGEHANHDMDRTPPLGTILVVGALSMVILAGAVVIVVYMLPAAV